MRHSVKIPALLLVAAALCAPVDGAVLVVAPSGGDFAQIQPAIDAAAAGDTVLVKPGEYVITVSITFRGKAITVRGEAGAEETVIRMAENPADANRASVVIFESGETEASVLEGVTLTGGRGTRNVSFPTPDGYDADAHGGGGICCARSSPTLTNCTISGNSADVGIWDGDGGGVLCLSSSPTLTNCTISGNSAGFGGGGLSCMLSSPTLTGCAISGNSAHGNGGGGAACLSSSPTLTNCTIAGNSAVGCGGGGVFCWEASATLTNCTISGNRGTSGGGVFCKEDSGTTLATCRIEGNLAEDGDGGGVYCLVGQVTLANCSIVGNKASLEPCIWGPCRMLSEGGGVYCYGGSHTLANCWIVGNDAIVGAGVFVLGSPTLTNCTIAGNRGEGVYCDLPSSPTCTNCTIVGNMAGMLWDGVSTCVSPKLTNCIVYDNRDGSLGSYSQDACFSGQVTYSCIAAGTVFPGEGNINADPLFVRRGVFDFLRRNAAGLPDFVVEEPDYRLQASSPCIDAGAAAGAPSFDIEGNGRPCGMGVDIGAHEAGGCELSKIMFARGDVNADGKRDVADAVSVLQFLFSGGATPLCLKAADANDSGKVNVADAIYLLSFIFAQGGRPPAPFPGCGIDLTLDELSCESFVPCMAAE